MIDIPKLDYGALFEPYTKDGNHLENAIRWLHKEATLKGIRIELVEVAINSVMQEVSNGKEFSKDGCSCGCESNKAGTAFVHAMHARMIAMDKDFQLDIVKAIQNHHNSSIKAYVTGQKDYKRAEAKKAKTEAKATNKRLKTEEKERKGKIKRIRKLAKR